MTSMLTCYARAALATPSHKVPTLYHAIDKKAIFIDKKSYFLQQIRHSGIVIYIIFQYNNNIVLSEKVNQLRIGSHTYKGEIVYHIAIVEDEKEFSEQLQAYLQQYAEENNIDIKVSAFYDGESILKDYASIYDAIFLDIQMPGRNGMETAEAIREMDEDVVMMFITNMAQYAILGYSIGALDFVMKPVNYYTFALKVGRVLKRIQKKVKAQGSIVISFPDGIKKLDTKQIYFVEVQNRMLHYHTDEGEFVVKGTMQSIERQLEANSFAKCNHWYMVNLMHVKEVRKNIVTVGTFNLEISRRNKNGFLKALTQYLGETL